MLFLKLKKNGYKLENCREDIFFVVYLKKKYCSWLILYVIIYEIIWEWLKCWFNLVGYNLYDMIYEIMWMFKFIEI